MRRAALVPATIAPVALIGGWTWGAHVQGPHYDSLRDTISALASRSAHDRVVMTAALALLGACHVATAAFLIPARYRGRVVLALGGIATMGVAALPQPSAGHVPVATAAFVALSAWPALSGVPTRRAARCASAVLALLLAGLFVELRSGELVGLGERVLAGSQALWPLYVVAVSVGTGAPRRRRVADGISV